ncbi:Protein tilB [Globomyces sp. JEL0801]|nr:Protein tilB [Globomyces sp. JEL0801]
MLNQFDIEKIENLDIYCRNLEILYLQSNQISKIENLHKLKRLEYLQLALNNITIIENLEGCESLTKLDLTVNFVEDLFCLENLKNNDQLRQLYLVGNPCAQLPGYRSFVIVTLPQLQFLDGKEIQKSERIIAHQDYKGIVENLKKERALKNGQEYNEEKASDDIDSSEELPDIEKKRQEFNTKLVAHSPEERLKAARELELLKKKETNHLEKKKPPKTRNLIGPDGRILQTNEGKWPFKWKDTEKCVRLTVELSKFLDTSNIDVDCHPTYICIKIKEKILQLTFEVSVKPDTMHCERSRLTGIILLAFILGELAITIVKASYTEVIDITKELGKEKFTISNVKKPPVKVERNRRYENLFNPSEAVNIKNIYDAKKANQNGKKPMMVGKIVDQVAISPLLDPADFVDDPDVPPLC